MKELLDNPVYHALLSRDAALGSGNDHVRFFDEEVSPFAGFDHSNEHGFEELHKLLPTGRKILYANPTQTGTPKGWRLFAHIAGLQFVLDKYIPARTGLQNPVPLKEKDIDAMIKLAALTKPGPFGKRTIEFGHYHGIFEQEQLVSMTGQRLHIADFSEISAVCTHPDHLGKGYAASLLHQQVNIILDAGQWPFLHVRADNTRAIELYERIGFKVSRPMNFYFLQKI